MIRVTIYNEYIHEREYEDIHRIYPDGIHGCIKAFLEKEADMTVNIATFDMEEHGLTEEVLKNTDVLIWWSHARQEEISDRVVERVCRHIRCGMGFIGLHSAHYSKVMRQILGTSMTLSWKHDVHEKLWCIDPTHPIAEGVPACIDIPCEEMYAEPFGIPKPDDVIFAGWFDKGYVFRSGVTFTRENGKLFYLQCGHESHPVYHMPEIQRIIINAVRYVRPIRRADKYPENIHLDI